MHEPVLGFATSQTRTRVRVWIDLDAGYVEWMFQNKDGDKGYSLYRGETRLGEEGAWRIAGGDVRETKAELFFES
jgi:hypothetical protein